jgi:hypothetical protein
MSPILGIRAAENRRALIREKDRGAPIRERGARAAPESPRRLPAVTRMHSRSQGPWGVGLGCPPLSAVVALAPSVRSLWNAVPVPLSVCSAGAAGRGRDGPPDSPVFTATSTPRSQSTARDRERAPSAASGRSSAGRRPGSAARGSARAPSPSDSNPPADGRGTVTIRLAPLLPLPYPICLPRLPDLSMPPPCRSPYSPPPPPPPPPQSLTPAIIRSLTPLTRSKGARTLQARTHTSVYLPSLLPGARRSVTRQTASCRARNGGGGQIRGGEGGTGSTGP